MLWFGRLIEQVDSGTDSEPSLSDRALGAYLGLAVGDALGATTEFLTPGEIREQHGSHRQISGGGWLHLKPGQVTDDTEMSLALGEAILARRGVEADAVAEAFSEWMRRKPVDIGNTVRRGIMHYRTTGRSSVEPNEHDAGNGACMRCLPVALSYWNAPAGQLVEASRRQAHVTHNAPASDAGTETVLSILVSALKGADKTTLQEPVRDLVQRHKAFCHDRRRIENPSAWIVDTLQAVFQAFFSHDSLEEILIDVVNRGGDADTTGAIAGMMAGAHYGTAAIPKQWLRVLDEGIRQDCQRQALALLALAEERS